MQRLERSMQIATQAGVVIEVELEARAAFCGCAVCVGHRISSAVASGQSGRGRSVRAMTIRVWCGDINLLEHLYQLMSDAVVDSSIIASKSIKA
eukprot:TRINITY_DN96562_c0_g1_i1.p1 TRINITY_DN96562_c0_g1~~TRINITY_DN96562_c0_g1_i1.p1  ORF type:complete len:103 (-),score=8.03 TRINITY_DN96562_c0_g1_i1:63-344(-)